MSHLPREGKLLRIFVGEQDKWHGQPLYQEIVGLARKQGLAGATCLKGFLGFGAHSQLHSAKLLDISEDLPVVIEIVDSEEKIRQFLPQLDEMVTSGLITMEKADVQLCRAKGVSAS